MEVIIFAISNGITLTISPDNYGGFIIHGSKGAFHFKRTVTSREAKSPEAVDDIMRYDITTWLNDINTKGTVTDYVET